MLETVLPIVGNAIQSSINSSQQQQNAQENFGQNLMLSQYQYNQQLDMWNRANAYNTPAAQMQRFKDAGLNPNLIYGQGNPGNSPNQLPRYEAPQYRQETDPAINIPAMLSGYQDFRIKAAQVDNLQAQRLNTQAETLIKALQAKSIAAGNYYNFGNQDYKNVVSPDADWGGNYQAKNSLMRSQASVASQTVDDMINKIRISNEVSGAQIPLINSRTEGQNLMNQYQGSINKFASGSQIANIISKVLPLLLRIR